MNISDIMAAMDALVTQYKSATADAVGAPMPDEAVARYEELEGMLKAAQRTEEIQKRQAAYRTTVTPLPLPQGNAQNMANAQSGSAVLRSYMTDPQNFMRSPENAQYRAQSEGIGSAGGFLVPITFMDKVIERLKAFGGFGNAAELLVTSAGNPMAYLTNDDVNNLGVVTPEGALMATGADLVLAQRTLGAWKYSTVGANSLPLKISWELLQDAEIDLEAFVAKKFAERIQRKLATDFVNGSGIGEPQGVLHGGLSNSTAWTSNTVPTYADLINMIHNLDPAYRDGASWSFNDKTLALIEKLVDTTGRPLIWPLQVGNITMDPNAKTLLGYPIVVDQAWPDPSGGNQFGFFGHINQTYIVRRVKDFTMVTLNELYAQNGQTGYLGWGRWDGMVQDVNAGILLQAA